MYIGEIYEPGLYKLDSEPILNSVDEYLNGFGTQILITLDTHKNIMVIRDFGRGIPVEKLVEVFTKRIPVGSLTIIRIVDESVQTALD